MRFTHMGGALSGCLFVAYVFSSGTLFGQSASTNSWTKPTSGNWDDASAWSLGILPGSSQSVLITNSVWKAVAINPTTPALFPDAMNVGSLTVGGPPDTVNTLLLNFFGAAPPLRVLNDMNIETNGRLVMLYSGLRVDKVLNLKGTFDQEGGQLVFTNSATNRMEIEDGRFNLTNGIVTGKNLYVGGTNEPYVIQASGVVSLDWLTLGWQSASVDPRGSYLLQNGWLIVGVHELVGQNGFGTLTQNGGTNSAQDVRIGNGAYMKTGGALFAGEVGLLSPEGNMTHAGGTATISNVVRLAGGSRLNPSPVTFNMIDGALSSPRIELEFAATFTQSGGTVNVASELFIEDGGPLLSSYNLNGGNLFAANATISSSSARLFQGGGTHIITNTLRVSGSDATYRLSGGTVTASNIVLTGNIHQPPQFFILGAPSSAITNENITLFGGAIVIQDSAQHFGRLTIESDSGINLAGGSAILGFADSRTNNWASQLIGVVPRLIVFNWNGSTNGGGADQLKFGSNSSALTPDQLGQITFVNPAGFPPGSNPAQMLSTGEVVPRPRPLIHATRSPNGMVISWMGNFQLYGSTNVAGPYAPISGAASPYTNSFDTPHGFFFLRSP